VKRPAGLGFVVIGNSAKKSVEAGLAGGAGLGGPVAGSPVICPCTEWLEDGGERLALDILDGGIGRGGPELEDILLVRGGGAVGCGAVTEVLGAGLRRVVTMSSGMS
jgi:hypothetical protein